MSTAILLDTETTGIDEPDVIELAYLGPLDTPLTDALPRSMRFRPTKPITLGAMATHHIIPDDVANCDPWQSPWDPRKHVSSSVAYLIAHNVDFDWRAIGEPPCKRICTLALARRYWPSLDSHTLSALIYHIYPPKMAREMVRGAHSAEHDVKLLSDVLYPLWETAGKPDTWEKLWRLSEQARVPTVFSFGKHKGRPIAEIKKADPSYISWCLSGKCDIVNDDPYWRKALQS